MPSNGGGRELARVNASAAARSVLSIRSRGYPYRAWWSSNSSRSTTSTEPSSHPMTSRSVSTETMRSHSTTGGCKYSRRTQLSGDLCTTQPSTSPPARGRGHRCPPYGRVPSPTKDGAGSAAPAPKPELVFAKHSDRGPVVRGTAPLLGDELHSQSMSCRGPRPPTCHAQGHDPYASSGEPGTKVAALRQRTAIAVARAAARSALPGADSGRMETLIASRSSSHSTSG